MQRLWEHLGDIAELWGDDCGARHVREVRDDPVRLERGGGGRRDEEDVGAQGGRLVGVVYPGRVAQISQSRRRRGD